MVVAEECNQLNLFSTLTNVCKLDFKIVIQEIKSKNLSLSFTEKLVMFNNIFDIISFHYKHL